MAPTLELTLGAAFLVGVFGSLHCIGMCGGIVGALTFGLPDTIRGNPYRLMPFLMAYNGGRILSYSTAGALAGWLGGHANRLVLHQAFTVGHLLAALFMIALGLYIAGWWSGLTRLEALGAHLWRHIEPIGRRCMPVRSTGRAFALGLIWGWLPCGLVYSALVWAMTAESAMHGGMLMLAFGAGTLPMLLLMGGAARWLGELVRRPVTRQIAGVLIIVIGLVSLSSGGGGHH
jgi:sulfite exporter TauE/SafE